jgi:hypothetical protein
MRLMLLEVTNCSILSVAAFLMLLFQQKRQRDEKINSSCTWARKQDEQ